MVVLKLKIDYQKKKSKTMGPQVVKGEQQGKNLKLKLDILEFMIRSEKTF